MNKAKLPKRVQRRFMKSKSAIAHPFSFLSLVAFIIACCVICAGQTTIIYAQQDNKSEVANRYLAQADAVGYKVGQRMGGGLLSIASKYGKQIPSSDEDLRGFAINFFNSELMLNSSWESERRDLESIRASAGAKSIYGPIRDAWLKGFFKGAKEVLKYN